MPDAVRSPVPPFLRSPGTQALFLVVVIAVAQALIVGAMLASQRDSAHIIDINGAQRMRTQRIAYLATAARDGTASPTWRAELQDTIDEFLRVRKELLSRRDVLPMPLDADGTFVVGRHVASFAAAAQRLVANPHDDAAYAYVRDNRVPLLAEVDATVKARSHIFDQRNVRLFIASGIGFAVMLAVVFAMWFYSVAPNDRRTARLLAKLARREAELTSLFNENPDAVGFYGLDGQIQRGNLASLELHGAKSISLVGEHFLRLVDPGQWERVGQAFERAVAGETVDLDTALVDAHGTPIDVHATLFPNMIDGEIRGVIAVARDMRALRRAEAAYVAQTERINELYRVSSLETKSPQRQIEETLAVAAQRLGYDWGAFVPIVGDAPGIASAFVGDAGPDFEDVLHLPQALFEHGRAATEAWTIGDLGQPPFDTVAVPRRWTSVAGETVGRGTALVGMLVLGSLDETHPQLETSDVDFLRLVAALVSASAQRDAQQRKLDALAFFDSLTGLPNRVQLGDRMRDVLAAAERYDRRFAVHCLDLDRFKPINDTYGHAVGDEVLRVVARRMERCTRETDTVARVGGDEFVIVQICDGTERSASVLAERVIASLQKPIAFGGIEHRVGISIGTAIFPGDGADAAGLLEAADVALLQAKRDGRGRQRFARPVALAPS